MSIPPTGASGDPAIFQRIFDEAPDAIVLVNAQGVISHVNAQVETLFGYPREELVGRPVEILIPTRFAKRHQGFRADYQQGPRTRPMGAGGELFGKRKNGSEFPVDIMLSPIETSGGKLVMAVVRDVTERRRIEAEAKAAAEMFFRLFEFAPDSIVVVDRAGVIVRANAKTETMFGYERGALIGQPVEILIPQRFAAGHLGYRTHYIAEPRTRPMGAGGELFGRRKDSSEFPVDIMLSPIETEQGRLVLGVVRDITERKQAEAQAKEALRREMLLKKEVHHRVKNNLQVISSLLYLQSMHTQDLAARAILKDCQSRVKSIALIHEKLYRSAEMAKLDFSEYMRDLIADLFRTYGVSQRPITSRITIDPVFLELDTAIPCGLIVNELLSNTLKHAFPGDRAGEVIVELVRVGESEFLLRVEDNGVGFPAGFEWQRSQSFGLRLIHDLTKQLDGTITVVTPPGSGSSFRITFKELLTRERGGSV